MFAQMRRAGMGIGISKAKLSEAMLEILLQLPEGTTNLKEVIVAPAGEKNCFFPGFWGKPAFRINHNPSENPRIHTKIPHHQL